MTKQYHGKEKLAEESVLCDIISSIGSVAGGIQRLTTLFQILHTVPPWQTRASHRATSRTWPGRRSSTWTLLT